MRANCPRGLQVPQAVFLMIQNLMTTAPTPRQHLDFRLAATVSNILVMINCSSNFVLYSSLSTKFRRTFRLLFCARCYRAATAKREGCAPTTAAAATGRTTAARTRIRHDYRLIDNQQTTL